MKNTPKLKSFNGVFACVLFFLFTCCTSHLNTAKYKVQAILDAVQLNVSENEYTSKYLVAIGNNRYELRRKACYSREGIIDSLVVFRSEGPVVYLKEALLSDSSILISADLPFSQYYSVESSDSILLVNGDLRTGGATTGTQQFYKIVSSVAFKTRFLELRR